MVTGLPGTGKSTLADGVAARLGAPSFSGDWLLGAIAPSHVLDEVDRDVSVDVYERLLQTLFTRQLMLGQSAVLDCIVSDETLGKWSTITATHGGRLVTVECVCSDEVVHRSRIEGRVRNIPGWHEIDWSHVEFMRREIVPLQAERLIVDAVRPADTNLNDVLTHLDSLSDVTR